MPYRCYVCDAEIMERPKRVTVNPSSFPPNAFDGVRGDLRSEHEGVIYLCDDCYDEWRNRQSPLDEVYDDCEMCYRLWKKEELYYHDRCSTWPDCYYTRLCPECWAELWRREGIEVPAQPRGRRYPDDGGPPDWDEWF